MRFPRFGGQFDPPLVTTEEFDGAHYGRTAPPHSGWWWFRVPRDPNKRSYMLTYGDV
jgi:hypothetical protein